MNNWRQSISTRLNFDRRVAAPLVLAAVLRLGLMVAAFALTGTQVMMGGDTTSYLDPGRNLIMHGAFSSAGAPEIDRTPGYPLFAMLTGMVFGNVVFTVLAQIAASFVSLLLVRRIADRIFPNTNAGVAAAWLFAIEPLSITYAVRLMPETLFVLLLLLLLDRVLAFQSTGKLYSLALAGVLLAVATYVRPVSYYLGFALAAGLVFTAPKQRGLRWKAPAILLIAFLPWLAAWQLRNRIETGYRGFSSIVETNLYFFQSAEVSAELQHITLGAQQKKLGYLSDADYIAVHPEQRQWSEKERLRFMRAQSMQILSAHPWLYLKTHIVGVGVVALTPCATELLQFFGAYPIDDAMPHRIVNEGVIHSLVRVFELYPKVILAMALLEALLLLLYGLAIRGSLRVHRNGLTLLTVVGVALYFLLISGGAQAIGRYRLPAMPELCILAGGGLALLHKKHLRGHGSPADAMHPLS
jgi:4-amino-4-deoxy-L-arabinose transferase-like glycosyltransferase